MDSSTRLDYVLFQLTPTRTRCDLVVFTGSNKKEKIASGLFEPFITHLKYAKEQIPKGGYSITLRPPLPDSSWFTKGTLERFVRFVSTPEVLERFVTIENEITQIENSIQANEILNNAVTVQTEEDADSNGNNSIVPYKPKGEEKGIDKAVHEENSKHRLQRLLETRKAVLRKEQAMAYARSFAAGYDLDCLGDLLAFADAFGASRLRDACISFKELCYKKHNDGLWMDELAAMEASVQPELPYMGTSGIILTTEANNPSQSIVQNFQNGGLTKGQLESDGSLDTSGSISATSHTTSDANQGQIPPTASQAQYPMSWPNQPPQFMYNFPNQQMSPYQGYPFPGMQIPPQYQGNMQWPLSREAYADGNRETSHRRNRKSKKERSTNGKESQASDQDELTASSNSTSEGEMDAYSQQDQKHSSAEQVHRRRNGKKSSRMVVIRNINYITSKRKDGDQNNESNDSSVDEDEFIDGDALKQRVEDAVGSLEKHKTPRHSKRGGGSKTVTTSNPDLEKDAFANTSEGAKTNENWGAFQNLLLREDESGTNDIETERSVDVRDEYFSIQSSESGRPYATSHAVEVESEQRTKQRMAATDFFVVTNRDEVDEGGTHLKNFEGENFYSSMKKRDCTDEELLFSQKNDDAIRDVQDTFSDCNNGSSLVKTQRGEDWFIVNQPEKSVGTYATRQSSVFSENSNVIQGNSYLQSERKSRNALVDDSFMIQDRPLAVDQPESQWRTDISMVSGLTVAPQREDSILDPLGDKSGMSGNYEPDDLYMVLDRGSGVVPAAAWATEMDYGMDMSFTEADKQHSGTKTDDCSADQPTDGTTTEIKSNGVSETKHSGQDTQSKPLRGSLGKSKTEIISRNKKPPTMSRVTMHKSKFETEEETRKRMEQLVIERQKRIAERSAARGSTPAASKKVPVESKKVANYVKDDKRTSHSATQVTRKLSLQKSGSVSSAVSRLTSSTASLKSTESKKTSSKVNGEVSGTLSPNTVREDNKKSKLNEAKSSKKLNVVTSPLSEVKDKDQTARSKVEVKVELLASQLPMDGVDISEDKKQHKGPSAITMAEQDSIVDVNKIYSEGPTAIRESSFPVCENYAKLDPSQLGNGDVYIATPILHVEKTIGHTSQINGVTTESRVDSLPAETKYALKLDEVLRTENERSLVSTEISEEEMTPNWNESTPPSISELSLDQTHSRRKWTSEESSPTTAKGFKKLLMFGRKKAQVAT